MESGVKIVRVNRPSDAARWIECSGALEATADYPAQGDNEFTAEGTAAHSIREMCLRFGFDPYDFIGTTQRVGPFQFDVDEEMAEHLMPGIDEIREFDGELFVEERVNTTEWVGLDSQGNEQFGTLDCGVVGQKLIFISDLKYGMGVAVQAAKNWQQVLYALAFWRQIARHISSATQFLICIDQPRNHAGGGYWSLSLDEMLALGEHIKVRAALTKIDGAPLTPGDKQCQWCPAANLPGKPGGCTAHHEWMAEQIDMKFDTLDKLDAVGVDWAPPRIHSLTPERKVHIVRVKSTVEKWLEKLHADVIADGLANRPTPGLKVVEGRNPPRKWRDAVPAEAWLEQRLGPDKIFNRKLISPKQSEKLLGKGKEPPNALVERGSPKPILVPLEDARPAVKSIDDKFDAMSDEII
jgi:hypothetical protein